MTRYAQLLAVVTRGEQIESEHYGYLAVCDTTGAVVRSVGDPDRPAFLRSSAKPFQAITALQTGAGDRFAWTDDELAVVCASHSGESNHLQTVRRILEKADLSEDLLGCGPHWPFHEASRDALIAAGQRPSKLHNNCSGKHSGMLAACLQRDWPLPNYLATDHPLQIGNLKTLCRFAGIEPASAPTAVDGCGVPTFSIPLRSSATAFARLANPEGLGIDDRAAALRVVSAMCGCPWHVAGTAVFNTLLMEFTGKRVVAKLGAEGVFCFGLVGMGLGMAIKVADGNPRVHPAVVCKLLSHWLADLDWREFEQRVNRPISNTRKEPVGEIRAAFSFDG